MLATCAHRSGFPGSVATCAHATIKDADTKLAAHKSRRHNLIKAMIRFLVSMIPITAQTSEASAFDAHSQIQMITDRCQKSSSSAGEWTSCQLEAAKRLSSQLAAVYNEALRREPGSNLGELLRVSQRSFLIYQKAVCSFESKQIEHEGDVFARGADAACDVRTTALRIEELTRQHFPTR